MTAAAAGELLPNAVHEKSPAAVIIGGGLGIILMLIVKELGGKVEGNLSRVFTVNCDRENTLINIYYELGEEYISISPLYSSPSDRDRQDC